MSDDCPQCFLPKDELAWQCDGCGHLFRRDLDNVRAELLAKHRSARVAFVVTILVSFAIVGGLVLLAMYGFIYVSVPLALALIGGIGYAGQRLGAVNQHLRELDRRLPAASVVER